jgi:DNA-binding NarL/FixJ family response regulator
MRDVLETDPQIQVVGEAANGEVAIQQAEELGPDVMIMDINLPDIMGLQVTRQIRGRRPEIKVVVITGYDDAEQAFHAIRAGASAYCAKDITPELLISTIYAVQQGYYVVDERKMTHDEVVKWVEEKVGRITGPITTDTEDSYVPLSPREMAML